MKTSEKCPKCAGKDIFVIKGSAGPHGSGNNIMVGISIFSAVGVDRYVCGRCGYTEEWIARENIEKVRRVGRALHSYAD